MNYAENCGECEYFVFSGRRDVGVCNRVDDPGFTYAVSVIRADCLWAVAGRKLDDCEVGRRREEAVERERNFRAHCKRANEIIESWPKWKRDLVGTA